MKHHDPARPIGKCKGCCLNFRTYCMAGLQPAAAWDGRRCKHYGDARRLEEMLHPPVLAGAALARLRRRERAVVAATAPHFNGVLSPNAMAGLARRQGR